MLTAHEVYLPKPSSSSRLPPLSLRVDWVLRPDFTVARGYDLEVVSELLAAAEAGLDEALSTNQGRGDGL